MKSLDELILLGKVLGSQPDLVQGGGGNVSVKEKDILYIKSSGCILSEINQDRGYSQVSLEKVKNILVQIKDIRNEDFGEALHSALSKPGLRPSMETPFHALISARLVVHIHPVQVLALVSRPNAQVRISNLFPDAIFMEYVSPGKALAMKFIEQTPDAKLYFLKNHGLIVAGENAKEILGTIENVLMICAQELKQKTIKIPFYQIISCFKEALNTYISVYHNPAFNNNLNYFPVCPDDVVYIGKQILKTEKLEPESLVEFSQKNGHLPRVLFYQGQTFFLGENIISARQVYEQYLGNIQARSYAPDLLPLPDEEVEFLSNWEAEKYRQKIKR